MSHLALHFLAIFLKVLERLALAKVAALVVFATVVLVRWRLRQRAPAGAEGSPA